MKRRELITLLGGTAVAWPFAVRAQQPAMPAIGFLHSGSATPPHKAFARGLTETGYVDGGNVRIDYRYAGGHYDRLAALAADLIQQQVAVLVACGGVHTAIAAKAATSTIPIVFANGSDPVKFGLVASLNRPGGNITGVSFFTAQLEGKRLGLLHELVPKGLTIAALVNPTNANADNQTKDLEASARTLGVQLHVLTAHSEDEIEGAFANLVQLRANALVVGSDPFFFARRQQLIALAARHAVPAIYEWRDFVDAGGLMSYGTSLTEAYRQAGIYAGRILKGEKPADLPVVQTVKFEFVINLTVAKVLGVDVPPGLSARADEVIE
ncbi:MAG TPA: ABC transporter substrate-binding protein [Xanthobacteraceae bacterium]|jgi:putative ABC transport system substrate-binding protein